MRACVRACEHVSVRVALTNSQPHSYPLAGITSHPTDWSVVEVLADLRATALHIEEHATSLSVGLCLTSAEVLRGVVDFIVRPTLLSSSFSASSSPSSASSASSSSSSVVVDPTVHAPLLELLAPLFRAIHSLAGCLAEGALCGIPAVSCR
jgi:hypothetical protein